MSLLQDHRLRRCKDNFPILMMKMTKTEDREEEKDEDQEDWHNDLHNQSGHFDEQHTEFNVDELLSNLGDVLAHT